MENGYQQARSNAVRLAEGLSDGVVVNVLNPTVGSRLRDGAEALGAMLRQEQTVPVLVRYQIEEARLLQGSVTVAVSRATRENFDVPKVLVVGHSQGTINIQAATKPLRLSARQGLDVVYVGTAVGRLHEGFGSFLNITDENDVVSRRLGGDRVIDATFNPERVNPSGELGYLDSEGDRAPPTYRQLTTNFDRDTDQTVLPTGNHHSLSLYLARPEVQRAMAERLRGAAPKAPYRPDYTAAPGTEANA